MYVKKTNSSLIHPLGFDNDELCLPKLKNGLIKKLFSKGFNVNVALV